MVLIGEARTHTTQKTMVCLPFNEDYQVTAGFEVSASIDSGFSLFWRADGDFLNDDGTGLPAGMMVIIQPRGPC